MNTDERLIIFDTTLRDGEQSPGISLGLAQKVEIAKALDGLGVDVIEAGFPAASEGDWKAVAAVAQVVRHAAVCALARCHEGDIDAAARALRQAQRPRIHVFIATSPVHRERKLKLSASEVLQKARWGIKRAAEHCADVEFSAEDATRTEPEFLREVVQAAIEAGARTINVPDTVGYATPADYAATIRQVCDVSSWHPAVVVSVHCHDDLGMAVANSLAGVGAGARQVECTVNGIGERAGNAALEEVVMAAMTRADCWNARPRIRTAGLLDASRLVSRLTGFAVSPNKAVVGANAFLHESGIHQHGVINDRQTYEIMRAEDVGARSSLVLGKHSGRHALDSWLREHGVSLTPEALEAAFAAFKAAADRHGTLTASQVLQLAQPAWRGEHHFELADLSQSRTSGGWHIGLTLKDPRGRPRWGRAQGGLHQAVAAAVGQAAGVDIKLVSARSELQSFGDGTQATATVLIRREGCESEGRALASCEAEAVAHAVLEALASLPSMQGAAS